MKKLYFIPISGRMGAGKTTFANELAGYFKQFSDIIPHVYSYADALRMELVDAGVAENTEQLQDQSYKMKLVSGFYKDIMLPRDFPKEIAEDTTVRQLMQWWGTEYRRAQNPFYWINQMQRNIEKDMLLDSAASHAFICDDVRFPNELELFTAMANNTPFGKRMAIYIQHWKYTVPGVGYSATEHIAPNSLGGKHPDDREHPSEFLLDVNESCYPVMWDMVITPSYRRLPTYAMMVFDRLMKDYGEDK